MNDYEYARDDFDEFDDDEYYDWGDYMKYVLTAYLTFMLIVPSTGNKIIDTIRYVITFLVSIYLVNKYDD